MKRSVVEAERHAIAMRSLDDLCRAAAELAVIPSTAYDFGRVVEVDDETAIGVTPARELRLHRFAVRHVGMETDSVLNEFTSSVERSCKDGERVELQLDGTGFLHDQRVPVRLVHENANHVVVVRLMLFRRAAEDGREGEHDDGHSEGTHRTSSFERVDVHHANGCTVAQPILHVNMMHMKRRERRH